MSPENPLVAAISAPSGNFSARSYFMNISTQCEPSELTEWLLGGSGWPDLTALRTACSHDMPFEWSE